MSRECLFSAAIAAAALLLCSQSAHCRSEDPSNARTYPVPDAVTDSPYAVAVDGRIVPIERAGAIQGAYYARFQFGGRVRATVAVKGQGDADITLKPERFRDNMISSAKNDISFNVSQPGPRVVIASIGGKELWPLILIAEERSRDKAPGGPGVLNVRDYGVTSEGLQTHNIQKALDDCAARKGGGTVYFPAGIYHTGTIRIRDNTAVYLAPGALIIGSTDPADYPVDEGRVEQGTHGPVCSNSRLIMFDHCVNSSLRGYGVVDGMGHIVRNQHKRHVQLVDVTGCRSVKIENIVLRNSAEWTLHILASDRVRVDNLKIINDHGVANTDGIDPDGSRDVYVSNYFAYCGDDAVAIKATGNSGLLRPASNIKFLDCTVMTRKTSYKIGTETYADISDVLFERCEAISSSRGIGLWECDGHSISNVTFRDMNLDLRELRGEGMSGEPLRAVIEGRHGFGKIKDITFDRVEFASPYRSLISGAAESAIEDITFRDCRFVVEPRQIKKGKTPLFSIEHAKRVTFERPAVQWPLTRMEDWNGFVRHEDSSDIHVPDMTESGG